MCKLDSTKLTLSSASSEGIVKLLEDFSIQSVSVPYNQISIFPLFFYY